MATDRTPPRPATGPDTASARGVVRDALGGFRNLLGLTRSIRVGPQAVGAVIEDVHASCAPMSRAIATLIAELPPPCRDELGAFMTGEVDAIERLLGALAGRPLRARDRLRLERTLSRVTRNGEIGLRLLALFGAVRHRRSVPVDVAELASEENALVAASPPATHPATLSVPPDGTAVMVDPALAAAVLAVAAGLLGPGPPEGAFRLDVTASEGACSLTLRHAAQAGSRSFTVLAPVPPTRPCLVAATAALGWTLALEADRVVLVVPSAPSP